MSVTHNSSTGLQRRADGDIRGNLNVQGSVTQDVTSALLKANSSGELVAAVAGTDYVSGSYLPLTGGTLTGPLTATSFTGSLLGTATSATQATTAGSANTATSASHAEFADQAGTALTADTAAVSYTHLTLPTNREV